MLAALALAPIVAVLPFRDVDGGGAEVGEATRALIAGELATAGLQVVPHDAVEAALQVQKLDPLREELSARAAAGLLKALNATALVSGAYAVEKDRVSLWARFFGPSKLAGTGSARGRSSEYLSLVHAIDLEMVRVLAIHDATWGKLVLARPGRLRSLEAVVLYGRSEREHDDEARRALLQRALDADPTFEAAVRALDGVEKRLPQHDPV